MGRIKNTKSSKKTSLKSRNISKTKTLKRKNVYAKKRVKPLKIMKSRFGSQLMIDEPDWGLIKSSLVINAIDSTKFDVVKFLKCLYNKYPNSELFMKLFNCLKCNSISLVELFRICKGYSSLDTVSDKLSKCFTELFENVYVAIESISVTLDKDLEKEKKLPSGLCVNEFFLCSILNLEGKYNTINLENFVKLYTDKYKSGDHKAFNDIRYKEIISDIKDNGKFISCNQSKIEQLFVDLCVILGTDQHKAKTTEQLKQNKYRCMVYKEYINNFPCFDEFTEELKNIASAKNSHNVKPMNDNEKDIEKGNINMEATIGKTMDENKEKESKEVFSAVIDAINNNDTGDVDVESVRRQAEATITELKRKNDIETKNLELKITEGKAKADEEKLEKELNELEAEKDKAEKEIYEAKKKQQDDAKHQKKLSEIEDDIAAKKLEQEAAKEKMRIEVENAKKELEELKTNNKELCELLKEVTTCGSYISKKYRLVESEQKLYNDKLGKYSIKGKSQLVLFEIYIGEITPLIKEMVNARDYIFDKVNNTEDKVFNSDKDINTIDGFKSEHLTEIKQKVDDALQILTNTEKELEAEKAAAAKKAAAATKIQAFARIVKNNKGKRDKLKKAKEELKKQTEAQEIISRAIRILNAKTKVANLRKAQEELEKKREEERKKLRVYTSEIVIYLCKFKVILNSISEDPSNLEIKLNKLNPVFTKLVFNIKFPDNIFKSDNLDKIDIYYGKRPEFLNKVNSEYKKENVDCLKLTLKAIKNDFEILRGPVRIYLKLKGAFGKESESNNLIEKVSDYNIKLSDFCVKTETVANANTFYDSVYDYIANNAISEKGKGPFSYVYDEKSGGNTVESRSAGAEEMFETTMKETIDNMIGSTNQVIMAYGPSGSGKTYNLIGEKFTTPSKKTNGVIKFALGHIMDNDNVDMVNVRSYQYYNMCTQSKNQTYKFDSLNSNTVFKDIEGMITDSNITVEEYVKRIKLKNNYKFKQSGDDKVITAHVLKEILKNSFDSTTLSAFTQGGKFTGNVIDTFKHELDNDNNITKTTLTFRQITREEKIEIEGKEKMDLGKKVDDKNLKYKQIQYIIMNGIKNDEKGVLVTPKVLFYTSDENVINFDHYMITRNGDDITINSDLGDISNLNVSNMYNLFTPIILSDIHSISGSQELVQQINGINEFFPRKLMFEKFENIIKKKGPNVFLFKQNNGLKVETNLRKIDNLHEKYYDFIFGDVMGKLINYINLFDQKFEFMKNKGSNSFIKLDEGMDYECAFEKLYLTAEKNRPSRGTPLNPDSSRSHLVFVFEIVTKDGKSTDLTFMDLAGNEKADENLFQMRYEGDGIMSSLLAIKDILKLKQDGSLELVPRVYGDQKNIEKYFSSKRVYNNCYKNNNSCYSDMYRKLSSLFYDDLTTVSLYLNLPKNMFIGDDVKISNQNRCQAIGDSLRLVYDLLNKTKISKYIDDSKDGIDTCLDKNKNKYPEMLAKSSFGRRATKSTRKTTKKTTKSARKTTKSTKKTAKSTRKNC